MSQFEFYVKMQMNAVVKSSTFLHFFVNILKSKTACELYGLQIVYATRGLQTLAQKCLTERFEPKFHQETPTKIAQAAQYTLVYWLYPAPHTVNILFSIFCLKDSKTIIIMIYCFQYIWSTKQIKETLYNINSLNVSLQTSSSTIKVI